MRRTLVYGALVLACAACGDGGQTLDTIPPISATAPTSTTTTPTTTTTTTTMTSAIAPATSVVDSTLPANQSLPLATPTATTLALGEGPWTVVSSIPEVTEAGLYYELSLPGMYVYFPARIAPSDPVFWTMNEADRPVIEAYLHAQLAINQAQVTRPMDFTLPGWERYFTNGGGSTKAVVQQRAAAGQVLDIAPGYVLRPWVIDDGRTATRATVVDCHQVGSVMRNPDGSIAPGSVEGWGRHGVSTTMQLVAGAWVVDAMFGWEDACTAFGPS